MWIKKSEYERLRSVEDSYYSLSDQSHKDSISLTEYKNKVGELEAEVQRLASLISEKTPDCNVGPWCNECQHAGCDSSSVNYPRVSGGWCMEIMGEVTYCKKHLHEICPEFELKNT